MPKIHAAEKDAAYEARKKSAAAIQAEMSKSGREIGELRPPKDPARRLKAQFNFQFFCETYFSETFNLEWSIDHLRVIEKIEQAVLWGGLFAMAMPRGSGKTSLCEIACLWAMLNGHHNFVCLIGASEAHAGEMLLSIQTEIESNELLDEDFNEVTRPIEALEGIANRANGQLYNGARTFITWTDSESVLPTVTLPDTPEWKQWRNNDGSSKASGAIIKVAGITGRIRGMKFKRRDGSSARPSLVILDDPQTDESSKSLSQCKTRERTLAGAVLGLAGPGKKISGIMPCTVIRPGDMADSILDRQKHPEWGGERTKLVYQFPGHGLDDTAREVTEKLWEQYAQIRADCLRDSRGIDDATKFYIENRELMDAGSKVAWPARKNPDEASALQNAMNLKFQNNEAFFAEYQNEPIPENEPDDQMLTPDEIARKLNGMARGSIPIGCTRLTSFIDIQGKLLFYTVVAWEENFTGYVIDYGAYPDQLRNHFSLRDAERTLQIEFKGSSQEATIYAGLEKLTEQLLKRSWNRDDGAEMKMDRCLIDANWGESTDVVYQFCKQSEFSPILIPSHGRYVGASSIPYSEYKRKPGDRVGHNWRIPTVQGKRAIRHVLFDTNFWKSFLHARLAVGMGGRGCLSLFGRNPHAHELISHHLTAEIRIKTEGRGRTVHEWKLPPHSPDNHWLDCLVGCAVAASMHGCVLSESSGPAAPRSGVRKMKLSELQRLKQSRGA